MATSVEAKIVNGLIAHFNGLTLPDGVRVAYPNVDFVPDSNPYVRLSVAPNTYDEPRIKGGREPVRMGLFLAVVCWPLGQGIVKPAELAGKIRDWFARDDDQRRVITHDGIEIWIGVEQAPSVNGDDQGDVFTEIPVVVPWHYFP